MNSSLKWRLTLFIVVIVLLASLIVWAAFYSWREVGVLRAQCSTQQLRSFEIADSLQIGISRLNHHRVRFEWQGQTVELDQYNAASLVLKAWIAQQQPLLKSAREKELLQRIARQYEHYLALATNGLGPLLPPTPGNAGLARINRMMEVSLALFDLGYELENAHRVSLEARLVDAQKSLTLLQWLIFGGLSALLLAGGSLSYMVYQEMIAPLQERLLETHALIGQQEKLASLGILAAGVAHEIRNPLTAIKARLFTLQKCLPTGSPPQEDALVIGREINRLDGIVREVLQFARPTDPTLCPIRGYEVLQEIHHLMNASLARNNIVLGLEILSDHSVLADRDQLKQVLINLVQNGAESIGSDGLITLRVRSALERWKGSLQSVLILEVEDTGKGISAEVSKRLFDPFFTTKEGGTGLGLAISARIMEKHGGTMVYGNGSRGGAVFGLVLPRQENL